MNNRNTFAFVAFLYLASAMCLCSCVSRSSDKISDDEELGDTVPASEFAVVEDTASVNANDTIVKK